MMFPSLDFESSASTSFTTPAWRLDTYSTGLSAVKKAGPALILGTPSRDRREPL